MNQTDSTNYESVLQVVRSWPRAERFTLVQEVLKTLEPEAEQPRHREPTLEKALRVVKLKGPAPTDEEVKQWLDEHRMEKYG